MNSREVTNNLISAVQDGFVSWEQVARACLNYVSEEDVIQICKANDFHIIPEEEEEYNELIIDSKNYNDLYYLVVEHPSRDHVLCVNKFKDNGVILKDNFVSQHNALIFLDYNSAFKASNELNSSCNVYVKAIGPIVKKQLDNLRLITTRIGKGYVSDHLYKFLEKQFIEEQKITQEKKYLKYLERKVEVCPLDKEECYDLYELRRKYNK